MADPIIAAPPWGPPAAVGTRAAGGGRLFDVVVVGAGLAGCSTALHLAQSRPDLGVALLDAGPTASGASGRGTGLLGPRLGPPVEVARRRLGDAATRRLHAHSERAVEQVIALAERYAPGAVHPCAGQLVVPRSAGEHQVLSRRARTYAELGFDVPLVAAGPRALPASPSTPALHHR